MSRHFLIDGYNVIKSTVYFAKMPLAAGRDALIRWLVIDRPCGSLNNKITVVFDGQSDVFGGAYQGGDVKVLFSQGCSADDCIRQIVEDAAKPVDITVVSDDKDITIYTRALGATIIPTGVFTSALADKPRGATLRKGYAKRQEPNKYVSHTKAAMINKELKKLWVKDD